MRPFCALSGSRPRRVGALVSVALALTTAVFLILSSSAPSLAAATTADAGLQSFSQPVSEAPYKFDSKLVYYKWLSDRIIVAQTFEGHIYRSHDQGRTWQDQTAAMGTAGVRIVTFKASKAMPGHVFFLGDGAHHVVTRDMGETYETVDHPLTDVQLHPSSPEWLLGSSQTPACAARAVHASDPKDDEAAMEKLTTHCFRQLFFSPDFGRTWTHLRDYVAQYDWALPHVAAAAHAAHGNDGHEGGGHPQGAAPTTMMYATVHREQSGSQVTGRWEKEMDFVVSYDLFKSEPTVLVEHGNRFLQGEKDFLFVVAVDPEQENEVQLQVSKGGGLLPTFTPAVLDAKLSEHSYTILDASEDAVFLHVNHKPSEDAPTSGHLYTSDSTGTQFTMSLPFNQRNEAGKCDFAKLEGLEGIYLANLVDELEMAKLGQHAEATSEEAREIQRHAIVRHGQELLVRTVLTFNKGGDWNYISRPLADANGNRYECEDCYLHLHGVTTNYGTFYSVPSAPGLVMATGNVGRFLSNVPGSTNTYFSRDAGLSWEEVARGSHVYDISNHGGLVVMVSDQEPTTKLLYSHSQGREWKEFTFSRVRHCFIANCSSDVCPETLLGGAAIACLLF